MMISLDQRAEQPLNIAPQTLSRAAFVERFGGVYEHSPWVAERTWQACFEDGMPGAGVTTVRALGTLMAETLSAASDAEKLELIRAHPDLAGKAAIAGDLTPDSTSEQASAGLDQCSLEEFERFQSLNTMYGYKFGFPFIMAVKFSTRSDILAAFEARLDNTVEAEFETAIAEINKIALIRLLEL